MAYLTPSGHKLLRSLAGGTAALALLTGHNFGGPPDDPGPPTFQNWYDEVFAKRDGTGVGPRVTSWTDAATWAAATTGVSNNGTTITVSADNLTVTAIDFTGFKLINNGDNNVFEDCLGDINDPGATSGNKRQWDMGGLNPTVRYCRFTNPQPRSGAIMLAFHDATGIAREEYNEFHDVVAPDPVKGPDAGTVFHSYGSVMYSIYLTNGAHVDTYDLRLSDPGSSIKRGLVVGDATPGSASATLPGTGFVNAARQAPADFGGAGGDSLIIEECIFVGHDDPGASSTLLDVGNAGSTGNVMYNVLVDIREHNSIIDNGNRMDDWLVYQIDWAQCLADGFITVGAYVPFPNLGSQPATVPSTMSAPVITAVPGGIQWADNTRPANQRDPIVQYDLRYSTDGLSWTTVADVSRTTDLISVADASNYRVQFRAVNGIGPGVWSASSNLVDVVAPSGTHRIAIFYGQSEFDQVILSSYDNAPTKPALTADSRVKFVYNNPNAGDPRPIVEKWLTDADSSVTGSMRAFANTLLHYSGPNDTWEIGFCTYTGLGWNVLFNDGSTKFPFSTVSAVAAALTGAPIRQYQSWLSANRTIGNNYARGFENLWLGTDNGTPITAPHAVKDNGGGTKFTANHLMPEVFDPTVSIPVLGQHKFDPRNDLDSFQTLTSGGTDFTLRDVGRCRDSVEAFFAGPNVGTSLRGAELSSYLNGYDNGSGGWSDVPHPGRDDEDGNQRFGGHLAYALCESLGLANAQPEITSVAWATDKITISSSAGAITNVFAARAESQLNPATFPHYTEAMGFYINGQPAERAEIVAGNIELYYGDGTQSFINTDTISFLPGGGSGALKIPEDFQNGVWKAVPCVAIGLPGDGLMNLRPAANLTTQFPNTLVNTVR